MKHNYPQALVDASEETREAAKAAVISSHHQALAEYAFTTSDTAEAADCWRRVQRYEAIRDAICAPEWS